MPRIVMPTLVIAGGASRELFRDTAARIAEVLRHGRLAVLERQDQRVPAMVVPVVAAFLDQARDDGTG